MANETISTGVAGLILDIQAESLLKLNDIVAVTQMCRWVDTEGTPGKTVDFPIYSTVASSDVGTPSEGADYTTNKAVTNAATAATVVENVLRATISDLAIMSSSTTNELVDSISTLFANGLNAKLEDDFVALGAGFSQTVAGAATTMTLDHWYDAIRQLKSAGADLNQIQAIISPKQYWGAKGLRAQLVDVSGGSRISDEMLMKGFVENPFGINIKVSNEINEDVAAGGDAAGMIFDKRAIGLHTKGLFNLEVQRDASLRGFELIAVGRWKAVELVDTWGIYALSDVS